MEYVLCIWVNGSLETNYMFSQIWAIGLGLITIALVSCSAYQLVCNSMEAHDLPSPVLVARIVEYWIDMDDFDNDDDFETSTLNGFMGTI